MKCKLDYLQTNAGCPGYIWGMRQDILSAFRAVPRGQFLPSDVADRAGLDAPLPIGFGQTSSQPSTVAMMLEWLEPESGNRVLDVGSGSGWTSALLRYLVGKHGSVTAVDRVPELVAFGRNNCRRAGVGKITFHRAGKVVGYPADAPYDRILVSASAAVVPPELLEQLAPNGRLVVPVHDTILVIDKNSTGALETRVYRGFSFVPLI